MGPFALPVMGIGFFGFFMGFFFNVVTPFRFHRWK
jgi:hypothetical protein